MHTENFSSQQIYLPEGRLLSHPRNIEMTSSLSNLEKAMHTGMILEGVATLCDRDLQVHVDLPAIPQAVAVIPPSEAVFNPTDLPVKDIAILTRVGKAVCFKVIDIKYMEGKPFLTLSRRRAQADCMNCHLSALQPGDIIPARVTHMESFGAFVDVGCGISSLMPLDAISVSRISHPRDRLYNGQGIYAVVKSMEYGDTGLPKRIFLSMRELLGTWEQNAARFSPGQTVSGIIRSVEAYGVFVELTPNLAGLAEWKEEYWGKGADVKAIAKAYTGKRATVFIKSIIPERMKIKLVLIDAYTEDAPSASTPVYYLPEDGGMHLDRWVYSPLGARKQIMSVFGDS